MSADAVEYWRSAKSGSSQEIRRFRGDSDEGLWHPGICSTCAATGRSSRLRRSRKRCGRLGLRGICPKWWKTSTVMDHADAYPVDQANRARDTVS